MPGAYYNSPTADGSRPGIYYVNTGSLEGRPLHQTATTSFHEANPGHHFQLSIEQEFDERLPLRRFGGFLVGDAFVEGWGLYSERLADEMGLFLDEYERLGMLEAQAFRAGRLIVDTGIHALGWDRERAVRQMMETGSTRLDSEIEVDRYVAMPGQALAYMLGKLEISRWRAERERAEGAAFDRRAFHDRVLAARVAPAGSPGPRAGRSRGLTDPQAIRNQGSSDGPSGWPRSGYRWLPRSEYQGAALVPTGLAVSGYTKPPRTRNHGSLWAPSGCPTSG